MNPQESTPHQKKDSKDAVDRSLSEHGLPSVPRSAECSEPGHDGGPIDRGDGVPVYAFPKGDGFYWYVRAEDIESRRSRD